MNFEIFDLISCGYFNIEEKIIFCEFWKINQNFLKKVKKENYCENLNHYSLYGILRSYNISLIKLMKNSFSLSNKSSYLIEINFICNNEEIKEYFMITKKEFHSFLENFSTYVSQDEVPNTCNLFWKIEGF
jgi:hypothetical protein